MFVLCYGDLKNYFFKECVETFIRLGIETKVSFGEDEGEKLIPDFIFCVNDIRPELPDYLDSVPIVSWLGERPVFPYYNAMLSNGRKADYIFTTDKTFVDDLKKVTTDTYFLPLAAGDFKYNNLNKHNSDDITFVGNTMEKEIESYNECINPYFWVDNVKNIENAVCSSYENKRCSENIYNVVEKSLEISKYIKKITKNYNFNYIITNLNYNNVMSLVGMILTREKRIYYLKELSKDFSIKIYGELWSRYFEHNILCQPVNYKEIYKIYRNSKININISSMHMPTAQNSRIFDVPLSGGFIISDYRNYIEELFDIDTEIVTFENEEELKEKCKFYMKNENARNKIIHNAVERINKEHKFENRIEFIIKTIGLAKK